MNIVILAAGSGTRMLSAQPKVLHHLAGKPLIHYVIETACRLNPSKLVIVLSKQSQFIKEIIKTNLAIEPIIVIQNKQLGTAHALKQALPKLLYSEQTLVLYADVPLVKIETLKELIKNKENSPTSLGILTTLIQNPTGYGRILRDNKNHVRRIIEEKDASPTERKICEINTGIMLVPTNYLNQWLNKITPDNTQNEFLLTDIIPLALEDEVKIFTQQAIYSTYVLGINNRKQLAELERQFQLSLAQKILEKGTTLADPKRFDLRGVLECGKDVFIDINAIIEGEVKIGDRVIIGANCILKNCSIGNDSIIEPFSLIDSAKIGNNVIIGPYARLRPGSILADNVKIGNFVEIKNTKLNEKTKVNHLSYIGDASIGKNVNIGAGTITCNYDGETKHKTIIGDDVFVGSDCQLIAPLEIGNNKTIAAGTTIWRNISSNEKELILNSKIQTSAPLKAKKKSNKCSFLNKEYDK